MTRNIVPKLLPSVAGHSCFRIEKITDKTRVIFAETIGNPKLDVTDIRSEERRVGKEC